MARYKDQTEKKDTQDAVWDEFCQVVADLETVDSVRRFFRDLFNRQERLMFARRLHIAALLVVGATYEEINSAMGAGEGTIARVHRWVNFGRGGYLRAIAKLPDRDKKKLKKKLFILYRT